jgi:hypothetical protein
MYGLNLKKLPAVLLLSLLLLLGLVPQGTQGFSNLLNKGGTVGRRRERVTAATVPSVRRFSSAAAASTALFASHPERSCIELTDPVTGCEVVLVGCFHGSPSSAADVEREILARPTDVIALELCATRFADLRKTMPKAPQPLGPARLLRFINVVGTTIQKRGLSTGIATAILGSVSGLQTALSGFTPGLEFTTALELSQQQQQQEQSTIVRQCDLILADQSVDETIEKVGKFPEIVKIMFGELLSNRGKGSSLDDTEWGQAAKALSVALGGDPSLRPDYQVTIPEVITRNSAVVQELLRLTVPPILAMQLTLTVINQALYAAPTFGTISGIDPSLSYYAAVAEAAALTTSLATLGESTNTNLLEQASSWIFYMLPHAALLSFFLAIAYAVLAVPVTKVILAERDDQLAKGIQAACRLAGEKRPDGQGRVVAVLGLLHVNGVAQRLLKQEERIPPIKP